MQFIDRYTILGHFHTAGPKSHVSVPHVSMMTLLYVWLLFSFKKQNKKKKQRQQQKNAVQDTITVTPLINTVLWVPYLVYTVYICF